MSTPKSIFAPSADTNTFDRNQAESQIALEYLAEAWNSAEEDGVETIALAHASLFAALATFVKLHGDDAAAVLIEQLPNRLRNGEYNLERVLQ
jgi:hypothetical protein